MALIKCPECGQKVSSLSITCPNCSTRIKGNIHQCPHCGEWTLADKEACVACGKEICTQSVKEASATSKNNDTENENTTQGQLNHTKNDKVRKPKKKNGCVIALICFSILMICLGAAGYGLYKYLEIQKAEKKAIQEELIKRIEENKKANAERLLLMQQDSSYWQKTFKAKTIEDTEAYINAYPEGIFINEAYMLLEELKRRKVSSSEESLIRMAVEKELEDYRKKRMRKKESDVLGIHPQISDKLKITKKYINRDTFQYIVRGNVIVTINRTNPKKPHNQDIKMLITMDSDMKIIESNLE